MCGRVCVWEGVCVCGWEGVCVDAAPHLPRGSSPSSLRQRTVGGGSPWTSHRKSTVSSSITTWLTGRRISTGRSGGGGEEEEKRRRRGGESLCPPERELQMVIRRIVVHVN